jgi:uncharacterized BrkB/YihY/UPF0761 family membrane protein
MATNLPPEVASFFGSLIEESFDVVEDQRGIVLVLALLVAFWSGSRAVYTVQKALRLVQGVPDERGYVLSRLTGVVVTVVGFFAIGVAYVALVLGENALAWVADVTPVRGRGLGALIPVGVVFVFVSGLLLVIYRYGPPRPLKFSLLNAVVVSAAMILGSMAMSAVLPQLDTATIAVLGSIGFVLVWLYGAGVAVIAIPIAVISLFGALENRRLR